MKIFLFVLLITGSIFSQQKYLTIEKNNQGGFNFYNNAGELVFKYTKLNCDSASLATMSDLYFESDSVKNNITKVEIVNIPNETWWNIYSPYISVLIGVFFGWLFSHYSQKTLIREQFILTQKETHLNDFITTSSEFYTNAFFYQKEFIKGLNDLARNNELIGYFSTESYKTFASEIMQKGLKFRNLLNTKNELENNLYIVLITYLGTFDATLKSEAERDLMEKSLDDYLKQILTLTQSIIEARRKTLLKK